MRPLTLETPKPLIEINGKSLIQRAIEHARSYGIEDFFVSTKHMSEKIEDALGDGSDLGVKVTYLKETQPLGTAGCLSLLAGKLTSRNLIVQNSDILTTLNISDLVQELQSPQVSAVVCGKEFLWQNPFGVLDHDSGFLTTIREKPTTSFLVSAGVYGFRASMLEVIDFPSGRFDMPEMLTQIKGLGGNVRVYEVEDYWRDVGTIESLRLAEKELARD
jgi:NDP-sugar pyrophosphorylase family protein